MPSEREKALIEALDIVAHMRDHELNRDWREAHERVVIRLKALLDKPTDGWIPWQGGECPVDPNTVVAVRLRDGCNCETDLPAREWLWFHLGNDDDIIAYKIISEPEEITPKATATAGYSPKTCPEEISPLDRPVTVRELVEVLRRADARYPHPGMAYMADLLEAKGE